MIETPRLRLRPPHPGDAPALQALLSPAISRWLGNWPVPFTLEMAQTRIERSLDAMIQKQALVYAVEVHGNLAGWIGGAAPPDSRQGKFGYWLGEPY